MGAAERLESLVGFDPAKNLSPGNEVLQEALKHLKEEQRQAALVSTKELLVKAIDLRKQMAAKKKEFDQQFQRSEKELGKVLSKLEAMSQGKTLEEVEDKPEESVKIPDQNST